MKHRLTIQRKRIDHHEATTSSPPSSEHTPNPLADSIQQVVSSPGQALDDATRAEMEAHFQYDFSSIRIFADQQATTTARALNAQAFTVGPNIIFDADQYAPASPEGQRLIAHELAHAVQQAQGPVSGTALGPGLAVSDPADPFEQAADQEAARIGVTRSPSVTSTPMPTVDRVGGAVDQTTAEEPVTDGQLSTPDRMAGEIASPVVQRKVADAANPDDDENLRRRLLGLDLVGARGALVDQADLRGGVAPSVSFDVDSAPLGLAAGIPDTERARTLRPWLLGGEDALDISDGAPAVPPVWFGQMLAGSEAGDHDGLRRVSPNPTGPSGPAQQATTAESDAIPEGARSQAPLAADSHSPGLANASPTGSSLSGTAARPAQAAAAGAEGTGAALSSAPTQMKLEPTAVAQDSPPIPAQGDAADVTARAQQQVAQVDEDAAAGRADAEAALAESAADRLPGLAELLEPPPEGALIDIPELPPLDPMVIDWNIGQQSADATALLSTLPPVLPADSALSIGLAAPEILPPVVPEPPQAPATPTLLVQRSARPGADAIEMDPDDVVDDEYDPVAARAQVRSIAGALDSIPGQAQQQMQTQVASITATLQATAQGMQPTVQASVTQRVGSVQSLYAQRRGALQVALQTTLDQIGTALQESITSATQKGTDAKSRLTTLFASHRTNVERAVADTLTTVDKLRQTRKAEAGQQIQERASAARRRGAAAARSYGGDARGQAQGSAASSVANKVAGEIESTRPGVEQSIDEIMKSIPEEVRARGQEALNGFDQGLPDLLRGVDDQVRATTETLNQAARGLTQQVQQMGTALGVQLDTQEQTTVTGLQGIVPQAVAQIGMLLSLTAPSISAAAQQAGAQIAQFVSQANSTLLGITTPDVESAQSYVAQVAGFATSAAADVGGALQEAVGPVTEQFALVQATTDTATQAVETQTGTTLEALTAGVEQSLSNLLTGVTTNFTGIVNSLDTPFSEVESRVNTELTGALTKLTDGFGKTVQDADREVLKAISNGVAKADEALGSLDGKMSEAAADAGWRYDNPVLAALKDIGGFVVGLVVGIVAVVALAVVVIVAASLLIAGLVALGLSSAVATLIVVVVGLGLLAYGVYQAYQARVNAGEGGGWLTLGAALLDVVGITDIYKGLTDPNLTPFERGFGIGRGVASVVTLFTGNRLNGLVRGRLPTAIKSPVRGSFWKSKGTHNDNIIANENVGQQGLSERTGGGINPDVDHHGNLSPESKRALDAVNIDKKVVQEVDINNPRQFRYRRNRKNIENNDKIKGQPEATDADVTRAAREAYAAERVAGRNNVEKVYMGEEADKFINPEAKPGTQQSADVVGVTKDGKYVLSEAKGKNIEHGLEQLKWSAEQIGREKVIRYEMVVPEDIQIGYIVRDRMLYVQIESGTYVPVLIYGKPIHITFTSIP